MVALVPSKGHHSFDLEGLARLLRSELPTYAVPIFVRLRPELGTTGTHKIKMYDLRNQGIDPDLISDPLYVMPPGREDYEELTPALYGEIVDGEHRF